LSIHIVVVEDDIDICEIVQFNLEVEGYKVTIIHDGEKGLDYLLDNPPDLLILDLMLPNINGLEIANSLRLETHTASLPILMLTARAEETDIVRGFEKGADDYVTKPFRPKELIARVQALLRRSGKGQDLVLSFRNIKINFTKLEVEIPGMSDHLTPKEFKLLQALFESKGRVLSRDQLLSLAWGYEYEGDPRTVDVHVRRLRSKLKNNSELIQTVKGFGYRLHEEVV
jgi:two-component system, OmpR family, alkaline phosphatase synthesis response regulator PhoP